MASAKIDPKDFPIRMLNSAGIEGLFLVAAVVEEGINRLTTGAVEFVSADRAVALEKLLGATVTLEIETPNGVRSWDALCISLEFLGIRSGNGHYRAELAPWAWSLTRAADCRVFQEMTVIDIVKEVLADHGVSHLLDERTTGSFEPRLFTLQYRERTLDFLIRLLEDEGIYFFFEPDTQKIVIADSPSAHQPLDPSVVDFISREGARAQKEHIFDWAGGVAMQTGKITLWDHNFETPSAQIAGSSAIPKGGHAGNDKEVYDYPGGDRHVGGVERRARFRMEAEAVDHRKVTGRGSVSHLRVGGTFQLAAHPRKAENRGYMIARLVHRMQLSGEAAPLGAAAPLGEGFGFAAAGADPYEVAIEAVPDDEQYRGRMATPKPLIHGVQTAVVTGPAGEEIHTDPYGRIKIQFHWDRLGKKDDTSSCWIRVVKDLAAAGYGSMFIPRIGSEVVVAFEEGDPDRPLVTGVVYNGDAMPAWELPAHKTRSGLRTNSSKGGGGFHELMFEDLAGSELVRFQSERDYEQVIKNDATITVGKEHKDKGDMSLEVHRNLTEKVLTGDHTARVEQGNQTLYVKGDKDETIEGKSDFTLTGNLTELIKQGNVTQTIKTGSFTQTLDLGNITRQAKVGKITEEAMQAIEFKVGGSSIKIDQMGVTIKGMMVKIEGTALLEAKSPTTMVKGDAVLIAKGGMVMIN